jgi:hypothetical protein
MKKVILAGILVLVLQAVPAGVSAHQAGPCNESGEPGNSDFAQHHIVPAAQAGALGEGGHIPGSHRGFSACDPSGS